MKLYAFQPDGHGEYSFFVIADSKEQALKLIKSHCKDKGINEYNHRGIDTDYYIVSELEPYQVIDNPND